MGIIDCLCKKKKKFDDKLSFIFGLKNLGNTCFMNSSLQCILNSKKFLECLEKIPNKKNPNMRLINEILIFLDKLSQGETLLNPSNIKEILGEVEEKYKYYEQNDANEFITIFLNEILKETKGIGEYKVQNIPNEEFERKSFYKLENKFFLKNKSFLLNLFYGRLKREYICENGHTCLVKFNNYNTLILPHPDKSNKIIDLLNIYQQNKKINDKILCNLCQSEIKYSIKTSIYDIPEYFILCLEKETIYSSPCLDYPKILDSKDFTDNITDKYSLVSLIVYLGDRDRGHYTAICEKNDNLYHISDSNYTKIEPNEINDRNAIILFYEKI